MSFLLYTYPFGYLILSVRIVMKLTVQPPSAKNCSISFLSALKLTFYIKTLRLSRSSVGFADEDGFFSNFIDYAADSPSGLAYFA
jgi:hypothetical protein